MLEKRKGWTSEGAKMGRKRKKKNFLSRPVSALTGKRIEDNCVNKPPAQTVFAYVYLAIALPQTKILYTED